MSDVHERKAERDPLEQVAAFMDASNLLAESALEAYKRPSAELITSVYECKKEAILSMSPLIHANFFADPDDREIAGIAIGTVMEATTHLYKTATIIKPEEPINLVFSNDSKDKSLEILFNEPGEDEVHPVVAGLINVYEASVQNIFDKLMTADAVVDYGFAVMARAERRRRAINFGVVAAASFVGISAANLLTRKK